MTEVVAALIWEGETFLICQRPAHKARGLLWEFVGGKVEPGETREEALVRECREELDIRVAVGEPFMEVIHAYPDLTVHLTLFHASIAEGTKIRQGQRLNGAGLDASGVRLRHMTDGVLTGDQNYRRAGGQDPCPSHLILSCFRSGSVIPASLRSAHYSGKNEGPFAAPAACPAGREAHW